MKKLREKSIIYLSLLMLLLSICSIAYDASCSHPYMDSINHSNPSKTQLSGDDEIAIEYFTADISLSSDLSFTRIEQMNRLLNRVNRVFNSIFAILFKIAVIPVLTLIIAVLMFSLLFSTRWWILEYIHNADGKKEKSIFLLV